MRLQSQYAANTMFIASLFCSKLSGTMSLRIMSHSNHKWIIFGCEAVVGLWGFTALVVNFFQCRLPTPWRYADVHECIDRTAFWTYYSVANIITDIAIVVIMGENVRKIQTSWAKKTLVMGVFGSRILYVLITRWGLMMIHMLRIRKLTIEKRYTRDRRTNLLLEQGVCFR